MKYFYKYNDFISEGILIDTKKKNEIDFRIEADNHFYERLSRGDNEPDKNGNIIISEDEVINDINLSLGKILLKNFFNNGLYWVKGTNKLNKDILISNQKSKLNIIILISKEKNKYVVTIKSVMRKTNFIISNKEKTEILYI